MIKGAEYQANDAVLFPKHALNQNVPCARCLAPRSAVMMLPAMRTCPKDWTREYEGRPQM